MARILHIRKPTTREIEQMENLLESESDLRVQRRAQVILYYGEGLSGIEIATALQVHPNTVYADLRAFETKALACLCPLPQGGAPMRFTSAQLAEIYRLAECPPQDVGLVDARWTLSNFQDFLIRKCRLLKSISREHLRRVLKKRTFAFGPFAASWLAMTHNAKRFWLVFVGHFGTCRPRACCSFSM